MREKYGDSITPGRLSCPICLEEFTAEEIIDHQDCIGCSKCGRWFHHDCLGLQKGWIGWRDFNCEEHGLQCHAATVEVGEVNTVSSISISASVPRAGRESNTLLHMQWLKRKRAKRIDDVDSVEFSEVVKKKVEVPSHMEHNFLR